MNGNTGDAVPKFQVRSLECLDCGVTFDWTVGEQEFFWSKGLAEPKRCPPCRKYRKMLLAREKALQERGGR